MDSNVLECASKLKKALRHFINDYDDSYKSYILGTPAKFLEKKMFVAEVVEYEVGGMVKSLVKKYGKDTVKEAYNLVRNELIDEYPELDFVISSATQSPRGSARDDLEGIELERHLARKQAANRYNAQVEAERAFNPKRQDTYDMFNTIYESCNKR